mgnify:CR=1 FL=1
MRAGKLDSTITVQRFTATVDDYGTPVESWATVATVRAQVIQANTEEFLRGAGATDETAVIFRVRWINGLKTADRVQWDGQTFNIKELKEIRRHKGLDIRCIALGNA